MSHQRHLSHDAVKEPHSVSVKVLRLSRPTLVPQYPLQPPSAASATTTGPLPASLAYRSSTNTNADPFLLSPILKLPASFGSAYVGETFSCTLCANNEVSADSGKRIHDVRIETEMKTPGLDAAHKLDLGPSADPARGKYLEAGETLQKVLSFDLKEEGNHILAVTVSYYEATETSGRTRTFRKLYQFICKPSLIVRTKVGALERSKQERYRWVLEAQLENCSEDTVQLDRVGMEMEEAFVYHDCNWGSSASEKPTLHPGEVEQVCFVIEVKEAAEVGGGVEGKITFGALWIGWKGRMGNKEFLSTGKLGTRVLR